MATTTNRVHSTTDGDVALSTAVVEAVSATTETPVRDLPVLHDVIDADALEDLFADSQTVGSVTFRYADRVVTVHADRTIEVSTR